MHCVHAAYGRYVSELLGLRKHAFIAYAGRMFETFELPLVEFCAFLRAADVVAQGGGLLVGRGGV